MRAGATLLAPLVLAGVLWLAVTASDASPDATTTSSTTTVTTPDPEVPVLEAKLRREHRRYLAARRRARGLHRSLLHRGSVTEAIGLACTVYGSCSTLWRRAKCESRLDPTARNASGASGLFQFLPSTFDSTPFRSLSIFSPYANSLAAGWMIEHGRGGEWSCQ